MVLMQLKYIFVSDMDPIIFRDDRNHADMAQALGIARKDIVSAGFLQITAHGARCYGSSTTLGIGHRLEDSEIINRLAGDNI